MIQLWAKTISGRSLGKTSLDELDVLWFRKSPAETVGQAFGRGQVLGSTGWGNARKHGDPIGVCSNLGASPTV